MGGKRWEGVESGLKGVIVVKDAVRFRDIFNLLLSPANNEILSLLSSGEYSTREIARILGRDEADVSRRLSRMRNLGLVEARWVKVSGRNVKLYRLKARRIIVDFTQGEGVRFLLETRESSSSETHVSVIPDNGFPKPGFFIGREEELKALFDGDNHVIVVYGLPGIGKTTLVSYYYSVLGGKPKYWHSFSGLDYYDFLVKKLALYLSSQGYDRLINLLATGNLEPRIAADLLVEGIDRLRLLLVFDDYHKCRDPKIRELVAYIASTIMKGKMIVVSRRLPPELSSIMGTVKILLKGLDPRGSLKLLHHYNIYLSPRDFTEVYIATQGHPGLLKLVAEVSLRKGLKAAKDLVAKGDIFTRLLSSLYSYLDVAEKEVLQILSCFDEPVPRSLLERLVPRRSIIRKIVYDLLDKGLVGLDNRGYYLLDLIRGFAKTIRKGYECKKCYRVAGDYYLGLGDVESYMKALRYYVLASHSKGIVEAIDYRVKRLRYQIEDYREPYMNLLGELVGLVDDARARGYMYHELALLYLNTNNYDDAEKYFNLVLNLLSPVKDRYILALTHARMILLAERELDISEAEEHADKALTLARDLEEPYNYIVESTVHANLGRVYAYSNMLDKVYEEVEKEYEASAKIGDPYDEVLSRFHLAIAKYMLYGRDEIIGDFLEILEAFRALGVKSKEIVLYGVLGQAYFDHGYYVEAEKYARKAFRELVENKSMLMACNAANYTIVSQLILGRDIDYKVLEWMDENCKCTEFTECIISQLILGIIYPGSNNRLDKALELAEKKANLIRSADNKLVQALIGFAEKKYPEITVQLKNILG